VESQIYTLAATENKRELVWDSTGKLINTTPYQLLEGKLLKSEKKILYYLPPLLVSSQDLALPSPYPYLALPAPLKETFLALPSNNIIYLPQPVPAIIYAYPSPPSVIYLLPPPLRDEFNNGLNIKFPDMYNIDKPIKVRPPLRDKINMSNLAIVV
jgi:hypothetical protein